MSRDLASVDPKWAWSRYAPDRSHPWDRRRAAHLFRRAGFGASAKEIDEAARRDPAEVVRGLIAGGEETESYRIEIDDLAASVLAGGKAKSLSAWWLYRMLRTAHPLREKTTLFWHGHFATGADKVTDLRAMFDQNRLFRRHAFGAFGDLVRGVARDPAMLVYLDSETNRKAHPNENFARELMELHCLGEGSYTEADVREVARCFTGWEIRRGRFRFNRYQHDAGEKSILGQRGAFGGEEAMRIILEQPAAARFLVRKLIRFFVLDDTEIPDPLVEPLAREFRETGLRVGPLLERILGSRLFFSEHAVGRKIRSPVDLAIGLLRALGGSTNVLALAEDLEQLGQALFFPPNVKGWAGGRAWINSSTLLARLNLIGRLLRDKTTRFGRRSLGARLDAIAPGSARVDRLLELLVAVPVPAAARTRLQTLVGGDPATLIQAFGALPEFQLG